VTTNIGSSSAGLTVTQGSSYSWILPTGVEVVSGSLNSFLAYNSLSICGYACLTYGGSGIGASFYSLSVGYGGLSVSGNVSLSGTFSGAHSGSWSGGLSPSSISCSGGVSATSFTRGGVDINQGLVSTNYHSEVISPIWTGWIPAYTSGGSYLGKVLYC
jgi:hypothetical protein